MTLAWASQAETQLAEIGLVGGDDADCGSLQGPFEPLGFSR